MNKAKGGGSAKVDKHFLSVNIINFAKVDRGVGGKTLFPQKSG